MQTIHLSSTCIILVLAGASAYDWKYTPDGNVAYASGCGFRLPNLEVITSAGVTNPDVLWCSQVCLANYACTSFVYNVNGDELCYLKTGRPYRGEAYSIKHSFCGYLSRAIFPPGQTQAVGCDWDNKDASITLDQDPNRCNQLCFIELNHGKIPCTHWTYRTDTGGICYLKYGKVVPAMAWAVNSKPSNAFQCGYIPAPAPPTTTTTTETPTTTTETPTTTSAATSTTESQGDVGATAPSTTEHPGQGWGWGRER